MGIENIFIIDSQKKLVRVTQKLKNDEKVVESDSEEDQDRNYNSVNREQNVPVNSGAGPFQVFFAQIFSNESYQNIVTDCERYNHYLIDKIEQRYDNQNIYN